MIKKDEIKTKSQKVKSKAGMDNRGIGSRLKMIRESLRFSQRKLAGFLEISPASLCSIEAGKNLPRHDVLYNLVKKFNVDIYYLLHGQGNMFVADVLKQRIESGEFKPYTVFLTEFLKYYRESPVVRFEMMNYFWKYFIENEGLIEKEIRYFEKKDKDMSGSFKNQ